VRTLNVRLTAILLAILTASGAGAYVLHAYHVQRNAYVFNRKAERLQEKAKQAAKAKNFKLAQETCQEAAKTLAMYVRLVPDDIDALEKLGFMLVDMAQDPRGLTRGWMTLERVLREDPERISARRRLVHVAIMLGRFHDAKQHLRAFL